MSSSTLTRITLSPISLMAMTPDSQSGNESSILLSGTVAVAELAMQWIVVPRGEILNAGSNPVGHLE